MYRSLWNTNDRLTLRTTYYMESSVSCMRIASRICVRKEQVVVTEGIRVVQFHPS